MSLIESAPAKINLTLRVIGRRADGYHELESLVVFADLADTLTLEPGAELSLRVAGPYAAASGPQTDNLVLKAAAALRERIAGLETGRFTLDKVVPVAAGIGGGSADAAAALRLLARANRLAPDDPRLAAAALAVGADVPVCLSARVRIMRGIGETLTGAFDLPDLPAVLVNPGVPLPTREVFAKLTLRDEGRPLDTPPADVASLLAWLSGHGNDLTDAAVACRPVIADVLAALRVLPGVRLARMSGSGPTCFAVFGSAAEARAAAARLRQVHDTWWVRAVRLGAMHERP